MSRHQRQSARKLKLRVPTHGTFPDETLDAAHTAVSLVNGDLTEALVACDKKHGG